MPRLVLGSVVGLLTLLGCEAATPAPGASASHHDGPPAPSSVASGVGADEGLAAVRAIHGGAGPWAVAGYRMGRYALGRLGLPPGSFDLAVTHHTPPEVQYSCIADGAAAATGASLGKLNLALADAPAAATRTEYKKRSTGETFTLRVTERFRAAYADVPRDRLAAAGREVIALPDDAIFETVP